MRQFNSRASLRSGTSPILQRCDAHYDALEVFRRKQCIAGQVLQCVDGAFCQPRPDWVVQGYTLGGAVEVGTEYFIDRTPSIRPSRKMELGMENLADYVQENPDLVVRRPRDGQ